MSAEQAEYRGFSRHLIGEIAHGDKRAIHAGQELAALRILRWYWGIGRLGERAEKYFEKMAHSVSSGQKMSLSEGADELLSNRWFEVKGTHNIPEAGPLVVVANHWERGPLHGMWETFLTSKMFHEVRPDQQIRWTIKDSFPFLFTGKELPGSAYIIDLIAKAYEDLIVVTAPFKVERRRVEKIPRSLIRTLRQGGAVGLYPEARGSAGLANGLEASGSLVEFVGRLRPETKVLPVGATSYGSHMILNFGEAFPISKIVREGRPQETSNELMRKVAPLVPEKYRGAFRNEPSLAVP